MEKGERGGGRSWFAVDLKSFEISIKGVEACCREEKFEKVVKSWEEEGRRFRLERHANEAGRFILCSVRDLEAKRVGLGIVGAKEGKRGEAQAEEEEKNRSFVEVAKAKVGRIGDAVWIQLGGQSFEKQGEAIRALSCGKVGSRVWPVSGFRLFKDLGEKAMEFERGKEAERVLGRGNRRFQNRFLHLERWIPEVGCFRLGIHANQCWVRAVGLPLNFWNWEWARLLVKTDERDLPWSLHLVVGSLCFVIQLWWEVPPWVLVAMLTQGRGWSKGDEGCMDLHMGSSMGHSGVQGSVGAVEEDRVEQVGVVSVEYGLGMAGIPRQGKGSGLSAHWAESIKGGNIKLLGAHEVCQRAVGLRESLAQKGHHLSLGGLEDGELRVSGQPICQEGLAQLDNIEGLKRVKAPVSSCVEPRLVEAIVGVASLVAVREKNGADEALLKEAFRYPHSETCSFLSFGEKEGSFKRSLDQKELKKLESSVNYCGVGEVRGYFRLLTEVGVLVVLGVESGFSRVYGPTLKEEREVCWVELGVVRGLWGGPWCVIGDFNVVRFPEENSRRGRLTYSMRKFLEIIEDLELRDLPLHGGSFTWKGGLNNHSRIDWFLVSNEWEEHFSGAVQSVLRKPVSNHFPILLDGGEPRGGPMLFRFENMWLKEEGFKEKEVDARSGANENFKKWALLEKISWRHKSREVWLREGDRNTSFFHKMANAQRRRNLLSRVGDLALGGCLLRGWSLWMQLGWRSLFWRFCEGGSHGFLREFHNHGRFVRSLNATFIVLIPKKGVAEDLRDCMPISLVGGLYKWLAKVLANRLKMVVGKVVSKAQNAFVEGRQILDAVFVANELVEICVPLDDFDLILGVDFLLRDKVALIPHLGGLMVLEEKQPCIVKALRAKDGGKGQPEMLSAIQLKKGLKKGQETYVAALIEIKERQSVDVLDLVVKILKEFRDVMPAELPKELPPQRPIDHKIELLPGTKAPAQAPYRMPPAELL
ncbi:hypothetical protein CK203_075677 [Vitis vinifera]|uniref:Uncharacterized protein n=1 Tax=Vitis vinifera TaxID=29760 RepID=A0A438EGM7_VITVI|nr:hypothetical protein CK203_075677 [Vitis vinifera]